MSVGCTDAGSEVRGGLQVLACDVSDGLDKRFPLLYGFLDRNDCPDV